MGRRKPTTVAKLTCPRAEGLFPRERLSAQLDKSDCALTWIEGPPGAGKTSLVVQWLRSRELQHIWYQIEAGDGSPENLFHYLGVALESESKASTKRASSHPLPKFDEARGEDPDRFCRRFFRAFFARLPRGTVMVFDNYQEAKPRQHIDELVRRAVEELPETLKIVVLSRDPTPPALARLRVEQRVRVMTWPELRFTEEESAKLVRDKLPAAVLSAQKIHERTGGWAGGLILTLEHLQRRGQLEPQAPRLGMDELFDYFTTQVLADVGNQKADLLLRMSYLPYLSAEDAVAITGQRVAADLLQGFSRRNLFIEARYAARTTYQFHALFRDFLQERAQSCFSAEDRVGLSKKAGELLEASGDLDAAFSLYKSAAADACIRQSIYAHAEKLFRQGRRVTLRGWIDALASDSRRGDPWLSYWRAMTLLGDGSPAQVRAQLDTAYREFGALDQSDGQLLAAAAAADSFFSDSSSWTGVDPWIDRLNLLLAGCETPRDAAQARAMMSYMRALLYRRPGDTHLASLAAALERVVDSAAAPDLKIACAGVLLAYYWWRGNEQAFRNIERRTKEEVASEDIAASTRLYYLFWVVVEYCKMCDYEGVKALVQQAREMADDTGLAPLSVELERFIAAVLLVRGEAARARAYLYKYLAPTLPQSRPVARVWYLNTLAACDIAEGNLKDAKRNIGASLELARAADNTLAELLTVPLVAMVLIENDEKAEAERHLLALTERAHNPRSDFEAAALGAYATLKEHGSLPEQNLREIVEYMRTQHYLPCYSWAPRMNIALLSRAAQHADLRGAVLEIVARFGLECTDFEIETWPWPMRIMALGQFGLQSLESGAKAQTKSARRLVELLQLLIASGPQGATNDAIVDALWPQSEGDSARKNLEVSLYRLRQMLGSQELLVSRNGRIQIERRLCWVDAWAFEDIARRLLSEHARSDHWALQAAKALELYRGDFLAGVSDAPWTLPTRARLRRLRDRLTAELSGYFEAEGKWTDVANLAERALELDPENEASYRRLMLAQSRMGDASGAAATYDRCRASLSAGLGAKPSKQTLDLYRRIQGDL